MSRCRRASACAKSHRPPSHTARFRHAILHTLRTGRPVCYHVLVTRTPAAGSVGVGYAHRPGRPAKTRRHSQQISLATTRGGSPMLRRSLFSSGAILAALAALRPAAAADAAPKLTADDYVEIQQL